MIGSSDRSELGSKFTEFDTEWFAPPLFAQDFVANFENDNAAAQADKGPGRRMHRLLDMKL